MSTNSIPAAASTEPTLNPMQLAGHTGFSSIPNDVLKLIYPRLDDFSKVMFEKTCKRLRGVGASVRKGVRIFHKREDFLNVALKSRYLSVVLATLKPGIEFLASKPKFVSVVAQGESLTLDKLFYEAARVGDLEALKTIYFSNPEIIERMWVARLFEYTAASGNEEAKTWLRTKGIKYKDDFDMVDGINVKYVKQRCPWDASTFTEAVKTGNLQILQFLQENSCPKNESTFAAAAEAGNVNVLKWLLKNGCPYHPETYNKVAKKLS